MQNKTFKPASTHQTQLRSAVLRIASQFFAFVIILSSLLAVSAATLQAAQAELDTAKKVTKADPEITKILEEALAGKKYPGVIAAIARADEPIRIAATGVRKTGTKIKITPDDMVHIGSCTKAMTATIAARFVDRKLLKWDTTLEEAWPEVSKAVHADWRKITLEQMLTHRSGLAAHIEFKKFKTTGDIRADRKKLAIKAMQDQPVHAPGSNFEYSNLGYMVAGGMLESLSGKAWEDLMREEIFAPLEMTSGGFGVVGTKGEIDQPWGHIRDALGNPFPIQTDNPAPLGPAGTVKVTVSDWAKFVLQHTEAGDENFISAAAQRELIKPGPSHQYAKGWFAVEQPWTDGIALNHAGSNTTWYALVWASRKKKVAYIVVLNCASDATTRKANDIVLELIQLDQK